MNNYSDEELVRRYTETQRNEYFEQLYERYCDKVYRKCLSFSKSPAQAEDLTHDVFLKLVLKLGSFKEQSKFSTWLYSITYNHCADYVRSAQRHTEVHIDEGWDRLDNSQDDELAELAEFEARKLKWALEKMPYEERTMLLMKYQDGASLRDIAELSGLTESAVKMRLKRSRDKLRKYYLEAVVFWLLLALKVAVLLRWPIR